MARIIPKEELDAERAVPMAPPPPAVDVQALAMAMAKAVASITVQAPNVRVDAPPAQEIVMPSQPKKWKFAIIRDRDGFISEITATAG